MKAHEIVTANLVIGKETVEAASGATFESINPATGEIVATVASGDAADIDRAVTAARAAFSEWSSTNPAERNRLVTRLAQLLEDRADEFARLDAVDTGRPLLDCREDIVASVALLRFFGGLADKIRGNTMPVQQGYIAYTQREPYGVIGAIVPWNYPIYNACVKVGPILVMGNTCVLKPAEQASLSALELGKLALEAGFPPGVLNVVSGLGETAGRALANHMDVDKISFTGSTETGRAIMEASARSNLKPMTLELGGKSPIIVFDDAKLEPALDSAVFSVFYNQGQTCTAATRLLAHESVAKEVIDGLVERASRVKLGDPMDETTHMGAVISVEQYDRVRNYIERGRSQGARVVHGGGKPSGELFDRGLFIEPTIFADVTPDMDIAREEIFGPVLSVLSFRDEDEAVELANAVSYGLAASVWTSNAARLARLANRINAGLIWGNCIFVENPGVPVGGFKQSGFGKEYGLEAGLEYTRLKTVWLDMTETAFKWAG